MTAAELRRTFDRSFAEPEAAEREPHERFLAVKIEGAPYALRLREVSSLLSVRKIVRLPETRSELLGVIGHRGGIVPVFDLATMLGHATSGAPRWLVLVGAAQSVGFAFEELEGQIEAPTSRVRTLGGGGDPSVGDSHHVKAALASAPLRGIIEVESLLDVINSPER